MIESGNLSSSVLSRDVTPQGRSSTRVIESGLNGLNAGQNLLTRSAQTVTFSSVSDRQAGAPISSSDIQQALLDQVRGEQLFNASAEVIAVGDENIGTLIDTLA